MQMMNIPIVASVALMSAYILSWMLPQKHHRSAIIFAFAFTLLSPVWAANVFLPLADAPYAAFTLAAILLSAEILCSEKPVRQRPAALTVLALLFAVSFALRFTAPVLLAFGGLLVLGRWRERKPSRQAVLLTLAVVPDRFFCSFSSTPMRFFAATSESRSSSLHGPTKADCC